MTFNIMKTTVAVVTVVCMTVLLATKAIDANEGIPVISMVTGILIGNGVAARQGVPVEPLVSKSSSIDGR